jgi:hypothetical protein
MLIRRLLTLAVLPFVLPVAAWAQGAPAGLVTRLEGNVTAARASLPQPVALKFRDGVFVNDRIVTGDQSIVRMLLGGKAVVTVRERSSLTITEVPRRSTMNLESGKIALAVARERMRAGDSIEIRTPNAVAGIRGPVVIAEYTQTTAQLGASGGGVGGLTTFFGLKGTFEATFGTQSFIVGPGQFAAGGAAGASTGTMTAEMRAGALSGLQIPTADVAHGGQDSAKDQALGTTVATFGHELASIQAAVGPRVENLIRDNRPVPNPQQPVWLPSGQPNLAPTNLLPTENGRVGGDAVPGNLFELVGRTGFTLADPDPDPVTGAPTELILGTDRPLHPAGGEPVFRANAGTVVEVRGSLYKVDTALLEATAPLLLVTGKGAVTTGSHAVDLTNRAKVSIPNDAVAMLNVERGTLNVLNGHLVNVAGGSRLNLAGDLLRIGSGGTVNIVNGALLNVSDASVASIDGALVRFTGSGGMLNVSNSLAPTTFLGGVPIYVASGATANLSLGTGALSGLNLGTIWINGTKLPANATMLPANAKPGSLITVQGAGGSVRVGRN